LPGNRDFHDIRDIVLGPSSIGHTAEANNQRHAGVHKKAFSADFGRLGVPNIRLLPTRLREYEYQESNTFGPIDGIKSR
jgi:hypothetical protein